MTNDDELKKPSVEVVADDDIVRAKEAWKSAAFKQARRADKMRTALKELRKTIDDVLQEDDKDDNV